MPQHRIVTYNVLSTELSHEKFFNKCDPADTKASTRTSRILEKLEAETSRGAIICLQEVSLSMDATLRQFFARFDYAFDCNHYSSFHSGYMGVAVAFPRARYSAEAVELRCISSDLPRAPRTPRPGPPSLTATVRDTLWALLVSPWTALRSVLTAARLYAPPRLASPREMDEWKLARYANNQVVLSRLRHSESGETLVVATYHMPCKFWQPKMMVIHAAQLVKTVKAFAGEAPFLIAGDFNFMPGSAPYRVMTEGGLPDGDASLPRDDGSGFSVRCTRMGSAYRDATGREPEFTNLAHTRMSETRFCACLDYVFTSPGLVGVAADPLPSKAETAGIKSFPTAEEPSDHILVAVEVESSKEA